MPRSLTILLALTLAACSTTQGPPTQPNDAEWRTLRKLPEDPFTKSSTTWQAVPAEPDPNNPTAEPGVYDVKSGSEATALDGSKYADW